MTRPLAIAFSAACLSLACGCATAPEPPSVTELPRPSEQRSPLARVPAAPVPAAPANAPEQTTLPIGVGLTADPGSFLISGALDFHLDRNLSAGPAVHIGTGDKTGLFSVFGQLKYWLLDDEGGRRMFSPFVQGGVGATYLDRDGRGSDWSSLVNVGGGVRVLTGDHYRVGSTALLNFLPSDPTGTSFYFSWEVIQVVFDF